LVKTSHAVVVTHPGIRRLYGDTVEASLARHGFGVDWAEVPDGEESKSLSQAGRVFDRLVECHCDRRTVLVALGGGVIGDLTGFVAATFMRGIPFIQVPTTLLSQVDSSVGGKTAVNHPRGKNLIGAFYQPRLVVIDTATLKTLPQDEFLAGMAEVIKYGVIADVDFFAYIERHADAILKQEPEALEHVIETSCAIKAGVVEKDERENHYRMVLNFGHTLGHAVEALTDYARYKHGEAVAMGMVFAAQLSVLAGRCPQPVADRIRVLVKKVGLPDQWPVRDAQSYIEAMYLDKKSADKKITFILARRIGEVEIVESIDESMLIRALKN
jgi:3-dehydroquinate synthase